MRSRQQRDMMNSIFPWAMRHFRRLPVRSSYAGVKWYMVKWIWAHSHQITSFCFLSRHRLHDIIQYYASRFVSISHFCQKIKWKNPLWISTSNPFWAKVTAVYVLFQSKYYWKLPSFIALLSSVSMRGPSLGFPRGKSYFGEHGASR